MPASAKQVQATSAYRKIQHESRAEAADPVGLVAMLYDELEIALGVLSAMIRSGQSISATEPAHRARMILIALDAGLDHQNGGALARSLSQIYGSMRRQTERAIQDADAAALAELLSGVQSLNQAWKAIQ